MIRGPALPTLAKAVPSLWKSHPMPEPVYRAATRDDLPFMVRLVADDAVAPSSDAWTAETAPLYEQAFAALAADPNQEIYIAELDGKPIGMFQLTFIPGLLRLGLWRGLVESVHIIPSQRNRGFGSQMMRHAIARCRARGCGVVQLTSNKQRLDAHRFYRALGFTQSHEGFKLFL